MINNQYNYIGSVVEYRTRRGSNNSNWKDLARYSYKFN